MHVLIPVLGLVFFEERAISFLKEFSREEFRLVLIEEKTSQAWKQYRKANYKQR